MKVFYCLILTAALLSGCASKPAVGNSNPNWLKQLHGDDRPHVGMQKGDVVRLYGNPETIRHTESGETWQYDNFKKFLIPFYFNYKVHIEIFNFDTNGILTSFSVDHY